MHRTGYFDCSAGVSGDMIVGALLDLGFDFGLLKSQLDRLPVEGYRIDRARESRGSVQGTRFIVQVTGAQPARTLLEIRGIIERAGLDAPAEAFALRVFTKLAEAEACVHGVTPEEVRFHEVGAVDSIVDIVGASIGFSVLGFKRGWSSAFNVGSGWVETQHGRLPVPAPATLELLKGAPVFSDGEEGEWTTPTGAALIRAVAEGFGPLPAMSIMAVGYGVGSRHRQRIPNVLRIVLGDSLEPSSMPVHERVTVIEANIDDLSPQVFGYLMERAMKHGALEFFYTSVQMKKDRPGTQLTLICQNEFRERLAELIFAETTTIGLRMHEVERRVLERQVVNVQTIHGTIGVKVARMGDRILNCAPEYEDCRHAAERHGVPIREVMSLAMAAFERVFK